jgi:hypothetical protein
VVDQTDDTNWAFTCNKTDGGDQMTAQKESLTSKGFWKRHLDKIGVGGSLFAALCCLGFPALVSILSAIGLGFLINDDILRPMMIVFLLLAIFGLALGMRHHGSPWVLIVGILSAVTKQFGPAIIVNKHSNKVVDIQGGSLQDGTHILQFSNHTAPNQEFLFVDAP